MPEYVPPIPSVGGDVHDDLAIKLDKVLKAAPTLAHAPDLAVAVAQMPGKIEDNAQAVGALHLINAVAKTVHTHVAENPDKYRHIINHSMTLGTE
jgi:hypothetical protein